MSRRDEAIIRCSCDTGGRFSEIARIDMDSDLNLPRRTLLVLGKGGKRMLVFSPKTGKAIGRYLRLRAKHPHAESTTRLWLGEHRRNGPLSDNGIKLMLRRRGAEAGVNDAIGRNLHAHLGRHFQSHHFLNAGGSEGDLMVLNGWSTPQMAHRPTLPPGSSFPQAKPIWLERP